jgi:hypothetical protein
MNTKEEIGTYDETSKKIIPVNEDEDDEEDDEE